MHKALILINSYFPTGVAMSSRMFNFSRLLRDAGWKVHVITGHHVNPDIQVGKIYDIEGITYQVANSKKQSSISTFFGDRSYIDAIKDYLNYNNVDCVFANSACEAYGAINKLCKKKSCSLFVEQCEWYDLSVYTFGKLDIRYLKTKKLRDNGFTGAKGVISISRLLDDYYRSIGKKSIRIPTILDVKNTKYKKDSDELQGKKHIVFAGNLGGTKELMEPIFKALLSREQYRNAIILDIYGPSKKEIIENIGGNISLLTLLDNTVILHGRVPQEKVSEVLYQSDYLIFVRPSRRSSDAGFPTKFAESMAVGTPVITNNTGDIGLYLRDSINGFMLQDSSWESVARCFDRILEIDKDSYVQLRDAARKTAERYFDYRVYMESVSAFFSK